MNKLAVLITVLFIAPAWSQVNSTGNLVDPNNWTNAGLVNQGLPCWQPGDPGCQPRPYVNNGNINFSYGTTDIYQQVNLAQALPYSGTGLLVNGYSFNYTAKVGNGWDDGRWDFLQSYVLLRRSDGVLQSSQVYTHNTTHDWSSFSLTRSFPDNRFTTQDIATARFGFVGRDNNNFAGPYGPEVTNISFTLQYKRDPCADSQLSSPSCPNFGKELAKMSALPSLPEPVVTQTTAITETTNKTTENTTTAMALVRSNARREESRSQTVGQDSSTTSETQRETRTVNITQDVQQQEVRIQTNTKQVQAVQSTISTDTTGNETTQPTATQETTNKSSEITVNTQNLVQSNTRNQIVSQEEPAAETQQETRTASITQDTPQQVRLQTTTKQVQTAQSTTSADITGSEITQPTDKVQTANRTDQVQQIRTSIVNTSSTTAKNVETKNEVEQVQMIERPQQVQSVNTGPSSVPPSAPIQAKIDNEPVQPVVLISLIRSPEPVQSIVNTDTSIISQIEPPRANTEIVSLQPVYQAPIMPITPTQNTTIETIITVEQPRIERVEVTQQEPIVSASANNLTDRTNPVNDLVQTTPTMASTAPAPMAQVNTRTQDNDLAGGVSIASIATVPVGFDAYNVALRDVAFYAPREIYRNQRVVDNTRLLRQISSDRLHQDMVDQQYRR